MLSLATRCSSDRVVTNISRYASAVPTEAQQISTHFPRCIHGIMFSRIDLSPIQPLALKEASSSFLDLPSHPSNAPPLRSCSTLLTSWSTFASLCLHQFKVTRTTCIQQQETKHMYLSRFLLLVPFMLHRHVWF